MQIEITSHDLEITPPLREYVNEKFDRIVRRYDALISVHVIMHLDKINHRIEATINASHKRIHAEASASDMYAAIDALVDKLDVQVRKHKEKITDHHRAEAAAIKIGT